jgi:hypothetical protein
MRWADLGPTPGSRPSSSIRSWTTPSYPGCPSLDPRQAEPAAHAAEALGEGAHRLLLELLRGAVGVADRGEDQVGQALGVVGVDGAGFDAKPDDLAPAGDGRVHQAAARRAGHLGLGQLLLGLQQAGLHLLGLLEQRRQVATAGLGWAVHCTLRFVRGPTADPASLRPGARGRVSWRRTRL